MSFLEDADTYETLEVVLAFIDACDASPRPGQCAAFSSTSSSSTADRSTRESAASLSLSEARVAAPQTSALSAPAAVRQPRRPRAAGVPDASRRQRERKKAETRQLRDEVAALEARLAALQRGRQVGDSLKLFLARLGGRKRSGQSAKGCGTEEQEEAEAESELLVATTPASAAAVWLEVARLQAHELLCSQTLNAELRGAIAQHAELAQSLDAVLRNKHQQAGLDLLRDEQRRFLLQQSSVLSQTSGLLAALQQRARAMHAKAPEVFGRAFWRGAGDSAACSLRLEPHVRFGQAVQLRMNSLLPCAADGAAQLVWRLAVALASPTQTPHFFLERTQLSSASFRKRFGIRLLDAPLGPLELQGTTFAESFEGGAGHRSYVWTSMIASSRAGDMFREEGWLAVSPAPGAADQCRFQLCYHAFCEMRGDADAPEQAAAQHEFVLRALGNRTRTYHQSKQNALVDFLSGFLSRPLPMLPPVSDMC